MVIDEVFVKLRVGCQTRIAQYPSSSPTQVCHLPFLTILKPDLPVSRDQQLGPTSHKILLHSK